MEANDLSDSLRNYEAQVSEALESTSAGPEYDSLVSLQSDLRELINLTNENLHAVNRKDNGGERLEGAEQRNGESGSRKGDPFADEYALFMSEMAESGAYEETKEQSQGPEDSNPAQQSAVDIEDDLNSLQGMKCAAYHIHKWGGAPTLHNAMVCGVVRETGDGHTDFKDIQVRVMYMHPTHREMLPCPYYLDGDCKFDDDQCKYSHGEVVSLSSLQEAIEPIFSELKKGSLVLAKLNYGEEVNLKQPSSEKYLLWHRAIVKEVDFKEKSCVVRFEHGFNLKNAKNQKTEDSVVTFENLFPMQENTADDESSSSSSSEMEGLVSTPSKYSTTTTEQQYQQALNISLINKPGAVQLGYWEKHTKGIGSKLMLAMGYIAGSGLGAEGMGRIEPVPATVLPQGKSLDHCMNLKQKGSDQDPLKMEKRLKRLQRRQEERNKQAYERAKDREHHNVFNFLNRTLGDEKLLNELSQTSAVSSSKMPDSELKQTSSKNLNIQQFKIAEEMKRVEREMVQLKNSLSRHALGSTINKNLRMQLDSKTRELQNLKTRENNVSNEQNTRKVKKHMTEF